MAAAEAGPAAAAPWSLLDDETWVSIIALVDGDRQRPTTLLPIMLTSRRFLGIATSFVLPAWTWWVGPTFGFDMDSFDSKVLKSPRFARLTAVALNVNVPKMMPKTWVDLAPRPRRTAEQLRHEIEMRGSTVRQETKRVSRELKGLLKPEEIVERAADAMASALSPSEARGVLVRPSLKVFWLACGNYVVPHRQPLRLGGADAFGYPYPQQELQAIPAALAAQAVALANPGGPPLLDALPFEQPPEQPEEEAAGAEAEGDDEDEDDGDRPSTERGPLCPCNSSHRMVWSTYSGGLYKNGWCCNTCRHNFGTARWFCRHCSADLCKSCAAHLGTEELSAVLSGCPRLEEVSLAAVALLDLPTAFQALPSGSSLQSLNLGRGVELTADLVNTLAERCPNLTTVSFHHVTAEAPLSPLVLACPKLASIELQTLWTSREAAAVESPIGPRKIPPGCSPSPFPDLTRVPVTSWSGSVSWADPPTRGRRASSGCGGGAIARRPGPAPAAAASPARRDGAHPQRLGAAGRSGAQSHVPGHERRVPRPNTGRGNGRGAHVHRKQACLCAVRRNRLVHGYEDPAATRLR